MARIALIGGHGKVALLVAPLLVDDGHQVTSVIRNPDHASEVAATGASPQVASVEELDVAALTEVLRDHEIVVWSAGAGGGNPARTYAVDRDAAIRTMDAAVAAGAERFVMVSYFGAGADHSVAEDDPFYAYAEAKAAADDHLRRTPLGWTILKPATLTSEPSRGRLNPAADTGGPTSRALVADVIRAVVAADPRTVAGVELEFTDGEVPVEEAVAAVRRR